MANWDDVNGGGLHENKGVVLGKSEEGDKKKVLKWLTEKILESKNRVTDKNNVTNNYNVLDISHLNLNGYIDNKIPLQNSDPTGRDNSANRAIIYDAHGNIINENAHNEKKYSVEAQFPNKFSQDEFDNRKNINRFPWFFPDTKEDCICVTGLDKEKFKAFFSLSKDYLFSAKNMEGYASYKTDINNFLFEFEKLFAKPYHINNCFRKAHFLAQVSVETDKFRTLEEYASGNHYNPGVHREAIARGNTQMGDGPKYKGRGCIHLTWKDTYAAYGKYAHEDLIKNYWKVASDLHLAVDSAGWFWKIFKSEDLNSLADSLETDKITKIIVGNTDVENKMKRRSITFQLIRDFNGMNCVNMKK